MPRRRNRSKRGNVNSGQSVSVTGISNPRVSIVPTGGQFSVVNTPILPPLMQRRLKYVQKYEYNPGAQVDDHVWQCSSLYDPDTTGTGHQPYGFDQLSALYYKYRVRKTRFSFTWTNTAAGAGTVILYPSFTTTSIVTPTCQEIPGAVWAQFTTAAAGQPSVTICIDIDHAKFLGRTRADFEADDLYAANYGSSPTIGMYIHVRVECDVNTTGKGTVEMVTESDFYQLQDPGAS